VRAESNPAAKTLLLQAPGIDIHAQNKKRNTPLHIAIEHKNSKTVKLLLDHGAKQDIPNNEQKTPIDLARETNSKAIKKQFGL